MRLAAPGCLAETCTDSPSNIWIENSSRNSNKSLLGRNYFSMRFKGAESRIQRVRNALKEKKPVICISTQLIEAGVDVDFGVVIRSLAGLDSVAQAAGRCNRHNIRAEGGRLLLVQLKDENVDRLVEIKEGQR